MKFHSNKRLLQLIFAIALSGAELSAKADDSLWQRLAEGGYVVLVRHAPVVEGKNGGDSLLRDPSCKKERRLSDEGRELARQLGEKFLTQQVPVSTVLHSPYCRTTDTALLAFGQAASADYLSLIENLPADQVTTQTQKLREVIGSFAGNGNLVLVTHEPNILTVSFETVKYLDMVVFEPMGGEDFEEIGVIRGN
jgi:phosphohistidine phosphatase SixA